MPVRFVYPGASACSEVSPVPLVLRLGITVNPRHVAGWLLSVVLPDRGPTGLRAPQIYAWHTL